MGLTPAPCYNADTRCTAVDGALVIAMTMHRCLCASYSEQSAVYWVCQVHFWGFFAASRDFESSTEMYNAVARSPISLQSASILLFKANLNA